MLVWPAAAVLGFLVLNAVVIALGFASTARYELERDGRSPGPQAPAPAEATGAPPSGDRPAGGPAGQYRSWLRAGGARARRHRPSFAGGGDASRPGAPVAPRSGGGHPATGRTLLRSRAEQAGSSSAGKATAGSAAAVGWWLIADADDHPDDGVAARVVAGPFPDELDATCAALASGLPAVARPQVVYARRRGDGALVRRQSPAERDWLAELGRHLDLLSDDWDELVSDTDELTSLVVEVTAALVEAGLPLYGADGPGGGVCLTPDPFGDGVLVTWRQHDRMSVQRVRGAAADAAVQQRMSAAIADVLAELGFGVQPFGGPGCYLVTVLQS